MSCFTIVDERRYPLKINQDNMIDFYRWEHRVTLGYRGRRLMVFLDNLVSTIYVEEVTAGGLEYIKDDKLVESVKRYAKANGFLNLMPPMMKR